MSSQDIENLKERHAKNSYWCGEAETPVFDLYHKWIGTPPTNPMDAEKFIVFSAGKMMETSLVSTLTKMGLVKEMTGDEQARVEMTRQGIPVTGYIDAIFTNGNPLEVKSFYGDYQAKELRSGKPRESYLKQLAMYMDFLGKDNGKLIYMDRGTGEMFEFDLVRTSDLKYKCLNVEFDLDDTYKRWARLYNNNIVPRKEPSAWENRYKIPVQEIDWSKVSNADISKARNNHKVIGDGWKINYSSYKNLILDRQGTVAGYTKEELDYIIKITRGYSSKKN
jgi:hypothetical protein